MFKCKVCNKEAPLEALAEACEKSHTCIHTDFTYVAEAIGSIHNSETDLGFLSINKVCTKCWTVVGELSVPVSDLPTQVLQDMYDLYIPKKANLVTVPHTKTH